MDGCSKVSEGCRGCYAERDLKRFYPGRDFGDVQFHSGRLDAPLKWKKPETIFVCSWGDLFHEKNTNDNINLVLAVIRGCQENFKGTQVNGHTFLILTKRPERMFNHMKDNREVFDYYRNCIFGTSVENDEAYRQRIPWLQKMYANLALRSFISFEPLLGEIKSVGHDMINLAWCRWIIVGGESGPRARPMHPDWAFKLHESARMANIPFFFKQWGEWLPIPDEEKPLPKLPKICRISPCGQDVTELPGLWDCRDQYFARVGKKKAGCLLGGQIVQERPKMFHELVEAYRRPGHPEPKEMT